MTERFYKDRKTLHFILLTTKTNYFTDYENRFYREIPNNAFNSLTQVTKELNIKQIKNLRKDENIADVKHFLKEYDNLKNLLRSFLVANFPYVSIAYGGFTEIHDQSLKFSIPLLNHNSSVCSICVGRNKPKSSNFLAKIFNWNNEGTKHEKVVEEKVVKKSKYHSQKSIGPQVSIY